MTIITRLFDQIVTISLMGSVLATGILLTKAVLKEKLSAKFQYYIWLLLLIRLLVPIQIESPISMMPTIPRAETTMQEAAVSNLPSTTKGPEQVQTGFSPVSGSHSLQNESQGQEPLWDPIKISMQTTALIWLLGVVLFLLFVAVINVRLRVRVGKCRICKENTILTILRRSKQNINLHRKVSVVMGEEFKSPLVFGILHPKIVISEEMLNRLSEEEIKYIFLHELAHVKRGDLLFNMLATCVQAIYWFNPLIWYAMFKMKQDCELSCDAMVLKALNTKEYRQYGFTIINMIKMVSEIAWMPGTVGFANKYNARRIIMITQYKKTSAKWGIVMLLTLGLLTGCTSLTKSGDKSTVNQSPNDQSSVVTVSEEVSQPTEENSNLQDSTDVENSETTQIDDSTDATAESYTADNTLIAESSTVAQVTQADAASEPAVTAGKDVYLSVAAGTTFDVYLKLLGLTKDEAQKAMKEEPTKVDEGGLEFSKAGIRVFFDTTSYTKVAQVFTQRKDIDFNGAKIGDSIENFKKAFGEPVSDKNGDMHFKYDKSYISVNYDTNSKETYAVYLLSEDF